ncbi:hypothetical protein MMPV_003246 [Pyropia vietnamensis]
MRAAFTTPPVASSAARPGSGGSRGSDAGGGRPPRRQVAATTAPGRRAVVRGLVRVAAVAGVATVAATVVGGQPAPACAAGRGEWSKLSDEEWRARLSPAAYAVLRLAATERPGSSPLDKEYRPGSFSCAGCGTPLYTSDGKFDSGTGWPSFFRALPDGGVTTRASMTDVLLRQREVICGECGGHLGHVFKDGPPPTGLRYCMNGVAMAFTPDA